MNRRPRPSLPPATDDEPSAASRFAASEASEDIVVGAAKHEQSLGNVASAFAEGDVVTASMARRSASSRPAVCGC